MRVFTMARPLQTGLNYFPLDVSIDQDDKLALIESDFGIEGFAVVIKLLMKIYTEGYFYHWGEKEQKLFSRKIGVEVSLVTAVVDAGLRWGLFSQTCFDEYGLLTSRGIQKRYFEAVSRRKDVQVVKEYLLLSKEEAEKHANLTIVSLFPETTEEYISLEPYTEQAELMSTLTTQSKVEESKGYESKSLSESDHDPLRSDDDVSTLLENYSLKIETPTKDVEKQLNKWMDVFDLGVIIEAIDRTHVHGKSYRYLNAILTDFKRKEVKTVKDIASYDQSFKQRHQSATKQSPRQESLPIWTAPEYVSDDQPVDEAMRESLNAKLQSIRNKKAVSVD